MHGLMEMCNLKHQALMDYHGILSVNVTGFRKLTLGYSLFLDSSISGYYLVHFNVSSTPITIPLYDL